MKIILQAAYFLLVLFLLLEILLFSKASSLKSAVLKSIYVFATTINILLYIAVFFSFRFLHGHFPIIYAKENLFFLSLVVYFISVFYLRGREKRAFNFTGLLISFLLLLLSWLPYYKPQPSNPFLESIWLYIHAISAALAHALYLISFIVSMNVIYRRFKGNFDSLGIEQMLFSMAKYVRLAFIFHTLMIGSGAIWAQKAWGRMWGWDPVEAWSLAAWLMYAAFLHQFSVRKSKNLASLALVFIGFIMLLISFWGIPYISGTIHTYLKF